MLYPIARFPSHLFLYSPSSLPLSLSLAFVTFLISSVIPYFRFRYCMCSGGSKCNHFHGDRSAAFWLRIHSPRQTRQFFMASSEQRPFKSSLHVRTGAGSPTARIAVRVLPDAVDGCHLFWSIQDVYAALSGPGAQMFGDFRKKRWNPMMTFIEECDVGKDLLLEGPATQRANASKAGVARCEWWPAVGTRALILLLLRWGCAQQQNGRVEHLASASQDMLCVLLASCDGTFEVAGDEVQAPTPYAVDGLRKVVFKVEQGVINLAEPKQMQPRDFRACLRPLLEEAGCTLLELLLAAPMFNTRLSRDAGYTAQLVWILGPRVEQAVLGCSAVELEAKHWWLNSFLDTDHVPVEPHERSAQCHAYVLRTAAMLQGCRVLAVAVDDGRAGRQPWKLSTWLLPDQNYGGWLAPQACIVYLERVFRKAFFYVY